MARKINLLLVRHAVSAANLDKAVNARLPDHQVPLAPPGHAQARAAGDAVVEWLKNPLREGSRTRILCSPYRRTRETSTGLEDALRAAGILYDRREELALREISFGLFDGLSDDELPVAFPKEHAYYQKHVEFEGEFYAPMPLGESRIQVADRVKGVFGTILRDNNPARTHATPVDNFIIVTHGVTLRAFMMQWLHESPEWYQEQTNPANASVTLISSDGIGPYETSEIFAGFPYKRTKQDQREEAKGL